MNTGSASPADNAQPKVLVWDAPVRVFHWLLAASFAGAWLTAESERWQLVHVTLGYTVAGLVAFRLVWGLIGTRHARFASFVRGPRAVIAYLRSLVSRRPEHHTGHNPAGAIAIIGLLALAIGVTSTGWATFNDVGGYRISELHEGIATFMLALAGIHVAGVAVSSWLHRENLVGSMITGRKPAEPRERIRRAWRGLAAVMLAAVVGFWWLQWQSPESGALAANPIRSWATMADHDDDD